MYTLGCWWSLRPVIDFEKGWKRGEDGPLACVYRWLKDLPIFVMVAVSWVLPSFTLQI